MLIIGSLLLIITCGALGLWLADRARRRPSELRSCLVALSLLDTEIFWGATPLPEAFSRIASRMSEPWRGFFLELQMRIERGEGAWAAWKATVAKQTQLFCLKPEDWLVILDVGKGLGRSDRGEQHKQLELAQRHLVQAREQAVSWSEKQAKMWSYLGFLVGFAVVVFLI